MTQTPPISELPKIDLSPIPFPERWKKALLGTWIIAPGTQLGGGHMTQEQVNALTLDSSLSVVAQDSLDAIMFVIDLEDEYNIDIPDPDLVDGKAQTFRDVYDYLVKRGVKIV